MSADPFLLDEIVLVCNSRFELRSLLYNGLLIENSEKSINHHELLPRNPSH